MAIRYHRVVLAKADFKMNNVNTVSPLQQTRALSLSTIAFAVSFALWTIFSIIGVQIQRDLNLSETEFGLLVGTPILTGSLIRLPLGIWTDQYGGRVVYLLVMLCLLYTSPSP